MNANSTTVNHFGFCPAYIIREWHARVIPFVSKEYANKAFTNFKDNKTCLQNYST